MNIVLYDEGRNLRQKFFLAHTCRTKISEALGIPIPGLAVDHLEEVESIKSKMHGAACGIKHSNIAGVLQFSIHMVFYCLIFRNRDFLSLFEKLDYGFFNEELTSVANARIAPRHLVPDPSNAVIDQKANHITRSEKLIPHRKFPAVTWGST